MSKKFNTEEFNWITSLVSIYVAVSLSVMGFFLHDFYTEQKTHNKEMESRLSRIEYKLGLPPYRTAQGMAQMCYIENHTVTR
jgi:hypothetical protein